jgi:amidophosphoribosyltransferase
MRSHGSDEGPHEACGIVGLCRRPPTGSDRDLGVARTCFFSLFTLQHRGQESAGICVGDGETIRCHKALGLVSQVFTEDNIQALRGHLGVGHVRYSTTGANVIRNSQPIEGSFRGQPFALGHNGNLVNTVELRQELERQGVEFGTSVDSEVIVKLIESMDAPDLESACLAAMPRLRGAFCLVIGSPDRVIVARDPWGIRPISIAQFEDGNGFVAASETCVYPTIGASFVREVEPGEVVVLTVDGIREIQAVPRQTNSICIFEFIYFARPDSHVYGRHLWGVRRSMGHLLAKEHPVEADIVIPVPDTAIPGAIGYAEASRIPFTEGLIKNRYIQRTFIQPEQRMRTLGVRMKLAPLRENLVGKRVVVVDDSIVRGTTTTQLVRLLRNAGAAQVHVRITSPPIRYPCFYGIDMATQQELIGHRMSVPEIRDYLGCESLGYLSLANTVRATGCAKASFCRACFDGRYPCPLPRDVKLEKHVLEDDRKDEDA